MENNFEEVWSRIKDATGLQNLKDLAEIVKRTGPAVSGAKAKNEFPPGWAYLVGKKYGILTEWIMTGTGPKRLKDLQNSSQLFEITIEIDEWIKEMIKEDHKRIDWFEVQFKDLFPAFKEWKNGKKTKTEEEDSTIYEKRVGNGWK